MINLTKILDKSSTAAKLSETKKTMEKFGKIRQDTTEGHSEAPHGSESTKAKFSKPESTKSANLPPAPHRSASKDAPNGFHAFTGGLLLLFNFRFQSVCYDRS